MFFLHFDFLNIFKNGFMILCFFFFFVTFLTKFRFQKNPETKISKITSVQNRHKMIENDEFRPRTSRNRKAQGLCVGCTKQSSSNSSGKSPKRRFCNVGTQCPRYLNFALKLSGRTDRHLDATNKRSPISGTDFRQKCTKIRKIR